MFKRTKIQPLHSQEDELGEEEEKIPYLTNKSEMKKFKYQFNKENENDVLDEMQSQIDKRSAIRSNKSKFTQNILPLNQEQKCLVDHDLNKNTVLMSDALADEYLNESMLGKK